IRVNEPGTFDVIISSEGPAVYLAFAFTEYSDDQQKEKPPIGVMESSLGGDGLPALNNRFYHDVRGCLSDGSLSDFFREAWTPEAGRQQFALAKKHFGKRDYLDAESCCKRALRIVEDFWGPSDPLIATVLNKLGMIYGAEGKYSESKAALERSLAIRERILKSDDSYAEASATLVNLGDIYVKLGDYPGAER